MDEFIASYQLNPLSSGKSQLYCIDTPILWKKVDASFGLLPTRVFLGSPLTLPQTASHLLAIDTRGPSGQLGTGQTFYTRGDSLY